MSQKHDEPPAYGNNPSYPQQAYYQGGGPPPQQQGAPGGYYQQQQPMGYGGHPQQGPPPGGYYQQGPYPPGQQPHYPPQEQKSSGPIANSGAALENEWAAYEIDYGMSDTTSSQIAWAPGRDRGMGRRTAHGL
ncbi:hypothetical protein F5144DRAFT_602618 [Chaetomium tenue]|uniref:Uncharacterized protein n=1 Tax=Chaetomium tenue TaxID=1854479 RepID=A0ACB7P6X5_9PEZI|nr:hypothetical protein F5144DRAFT_602618 [Chaetomium globosum]